MKLNQIINSYEAFTFRMIFSLVIEGPKDTTIYLKTFRWTSHEVLKGASKIFEFSTGL